MDDTFQEYYKWWHTFTMDLVDFHSDPMLNGMKPISQNKVIPDGITLPSVVALVESIQI